MRRKTIPMAAMSFALLGGSGCHSTPEGRLKLGGPASAAGVAEFRLIHADREPGNWMSHGRTYSEQRFSPLKQINDQNVGQLGLDDRVQLVVVVAEHVDHDGVLRGAEQGDKKPVHVVPRGKECSLVVRVSL